MNGISSAKTYVKELLEKEIDDGQLAGALVSVIKDGREIIAHSLGMADIENKVPIEKNTIFRIYSMSKPIAAVAANIQIERGKIDLYTPISEYIPEFRNTRVIKNGSLVNVNREILVRDLLNMTSGIVYPDCDEAGLHMERLFNKLQAKIESGESISALDMSKMIANEPLAFSPGEKWRYGLGVDVMGAIIEITSGKCLDEFYKNEIFEPLGMTDTDFYVHKDKQSRLAKFYTYNNSSKCLEEETSRHLCLTKCLEKPSFLSAGAGLLSTIEDYNKFVQMLVNYGELNGKRIISKRAVKLFMTNYLTDEQNKDKFEASLGYGYGNFMRVLTEPDKTGCYGSIGEFGWDGWPGPYMSVNPKENTTIVLMLQRTGYSNSQLIRSLRNIIYSVI